MRLGPALLVFALAISPGMAAAQHGIDELETYLAEQKLRRIAIVVGVEEYSAHENVKNAVADANLVAQILKSDELDFTVAQPVINPEKTEFDNAIQDFIGRYLNSGSDPAIVVFYFAGHGFQNEGKDYIALRDAPATSQIRRKSFPITSLANLLRTESTAVLLMFFDACRNEQRATLTGDSDAGFNQLNAKLHDGLFLGFASEPGQTALSSTQNTPDNSPFATALSKYLGQVEQLKDIFGGDVRSFVAVSTRPRSKQPTGYGLTGSHVFLNPVPDRIETEEMTANDILFRYLGYGEGNPKKQEAACDALDFVEKFPSSHSYARVKRLVDNHDIVLTTACL